MKNLGLVGILFLFAVLGIVGILMSAKAADTGLPVGTIIAWGGTDKSVPAGWMVCNGKALSKSGYQELFAAIGASWGSAGDKFNLPDLRGRFLRGVDSGTGRDPDATQRKPANPGGNSMGAGSIQGDSIQNHSHEQTPHYHMCGRYTGSMAVPTGSSTFYAVSWTSWITDFTSTSAASANLLGASRYNTKSQVLAGEESRPKNAAVTFIIKVK